MMGVKMIAKTKSRMMMPIRAWALSLFIFLLTAEGAEGFAEVAEKTPQRPLRYPLLPLRLNLLQLPYDIVELHIFTLLRFPIEQFDDTIADLLSDRDAKRNANQIRVLEFHARPLVAIVEQDVKTGVRQILVKLLARFAQFLIFHIRDGHDHVERCNRLWPNDAIGVVVLFHCGRDNSLDADSIAAHNDRDRLAFFS